MSDDEGFDVEFEDDILAQCLQDVDYLKSAAAIIEAHHFSTEQHGWIWGVLKDTWEGTAERTSAHGLLRRARADFSDEDERVSYIELASRLVHRKPTAPRAALGELARFVRFVKLQVAGEEMAKRLESGDVDRAYKVMGDAVRSANRATGFQVADWMGEITKRLTDQKFKRDHPDLFPIIPTGLKKMDAVIDGIRPKEVGLVLGTTGRGKSIIGVHLGYTAVKKRKDIGVVHVSTEMHHTQVSMRYDSRFTGFMHRKFKVFEFTASELEALSARIRRSFARYNGRLKIVSAPVRSVSLADTRRIVEELQDSMDVPIRLVVLDSADHFIPEQSYKDKRHERADIYWGAAGWADESDLSIWGMTQAGKQAAGRIARAEDTSESYDTARIADIVVSINAPESKTRATPKVEIGEDKEDDGSVTVASSADLELFLTKYRDGEGNVRIPLETDLRRMIIRDAATKAEAA